MFYLFIKTLEENKELSMKGLTALLNTQYNYNKNEVDFCIDYILQDYNVNRHGYKFNIETDTIVKLPNMFEESSDFSEPTEDEFWYGVQKLSDFAIMMIQTGKEKFSVMSYTRYMNKMLDKKIKIQSIIRYLSNEGLVLYKDEKDISILN